MATTKINKQIQSVIDDIKVFEKQVGAFKNPDIEINKDVPNSGTSTMEIKITYSDSTY
ncbi:hypothetical protein [Lactobacillus intestinalis]|uniref:hypothetical protein n=1 Tax=Lactobacillus intestinalis TaxID=151781 RepID=UPI001F590AF0|nr:hypothetical protein [Lactobacillus intestinalis]